MSGLLWFPRVSQGSARPPWCMARTLFASMQQCPPGCDRPNARNSDTKIRLIRRQRLRCLPPNL
jgi:hypothetical protein